MQLAAWQLERDALPPTFRQGMLVHGHQRLPLQAWPAAVGAWCSTASPAVAPVARTSALFNRSCANKTATAAASAAVSPRTATETSPAAGASGTDSAANDTDPALRRDSINIRRVRAIVASRDGAASRCSSKHGTHFADMVCDPSRKPQPVHVQRPGVTSASCPPFSSATCSSPASSAAVPRADRRTAV